MFLGMIRKSVQRFSEEIMRKTRGMMRLPPVFDKQARETRAGELPKNE